MLLENREFALNSALPTIKTSKKTHKNATNKQT
jgi:hypothetical protein